MAQGATMLHEGTFSKARDHLEEALSIYDPENHHYYAARSSIDPGVNSLSRLSWTLWMLGYPEQALNRSQEALALARQLGHVHSLSTVCGLPRSYTSSAGKSRRFMNTPKRRVNSQPSMIFTNGR
jgi:hypothetical protein